VTDPTKEKVDNISQTKQQQVQTLQKRDKEGKADREEILEE